MGILDRILPWRRDEFTQLGIEKYRLISLWGDIKPYLQRDVANIWIERVKWNFSEITEETEKIRLILSELHKHYKSEREDSDSGIYSQEMNDIDTFLSDLSNKQPSNEWIQLIYKDLAKILEDIEEEQKVDLSRRSAIKRLGLATAGVAAASVVGFGKGRSRNKKISVKKAEPQKRQAPQQRRGSLIVSHLSPRNSRRPIRPSTKFIILHTTEASDRSSLGSIHKDGTANFIVATNGTVYNTIELGRLAKHAGRSMWDGLSNISSHSVGIEVCGYHYKSITGAQYASLSSLIRYIQSRYPGISDNEVLTHSMVAFGRPNRYHRRSHRGRKRCGMQFATLEVRRRLGIADKPHFDPDIKAGRLVNADPYLARVIYGRETTPIKIEKATKIKKDEDEPDEKDERPAGFSEINKKNTTAWSIAGDEYDSSTTIYFFEDGIVRTGKQVKSSQLNALPKGTKVLVGYVYGGHVTADRPPSEIAREWNFPSTYYRLPNGKMINGDDVDPRKIPKGTLIFYRD